MTDEIDEMVRAAAKAHEALAPAGHLDELERRVLARLARGEPADDFSEAVMMSDTDNDSARDRSNPPPGGAGEQNEDSGLHDIRSLAQTAKQRISKRITSQHDAIDDSLSSSQSGLRAVALPEPARLVSLPDLAVGVRTGPVGSLTDLPAVGAVAPIAAGKKRTGLFVAIGGAVLAAAAAVVIVSGGGGSKAEAPAKEQVAATAVEPQAVGAGTSAPGGAAPAPAQAPAPALAQEVAAAEPTGGAAADGTAAGSAAAEDRAAVRDERKDPAVAAKVERTTDKKVKSDAPADKPASDKADAAGKAGKGADKTATGGAKVAGGGAPAASGGGEKSLEDLLNEASGGAQKPTGGGGGGAAPAGPEKTGLDGKDIKKGMSAVAKQAQACFDQYGVAGHVKVKATVDPSGSVVKADATGEFAGTPTGSCVSAAAKGATFPSWTGGPMTISYGFTLQE